MPVRRKPRQPPPTAAAVCVVPDHRMPDRSKMDANLVGPSRVKVSTEEIDRVEAGQSNEIGASHAASGNDRDACPVSRIAYKGLVDGHAVLGEMTP